MPRIPEKPDTDLPEGWRSPPEYRLQAEVPRRASTAGVRAEGRAGLKPRRTLPAEAGTPTQSPARGEH